MSEIKAVELSLTNGGKIEIVFTHFKEGKFFDTIVGKSTIWFPEVKKRFLRKPKYGDLQLDSEEDFYIFGRGRDWRDIKSGRELKENLFLEEVIAFWYLMKYTTTEMEPEEGNEESNP